ncbi:hypothetical protein K438DRAFT_375053 [Mycena galopus ATCC 62051]|nr:hypothetical protein K438DRAFT_375053 [Mycena galopus ATCC 62051]
MRLLFFRLPALPSRFSSPAVDDPPCWPSGDLRRPVFTDLAAHGWACFATMRRDLPRPRPPPPFPLPTRRRLRDAASPISRIGNTPRPTPTPIGDLAAPVFTQHYPSILHRAGLHLPLLKSVTVTLVPSRASLLGADTRPNYSPLIGDPAAPKLPSLLLWHPFLYVYLYPDPHPYCHMHLPPAATPPASTPPLCLYPTTHYTLYPPPAKSPA